MADFSVNATNLSAPRGAGANVLSPVQEQVVPDRVGPAAASMIVEAATGAYKAYKTEQAQQARDGYVGAYTQEIQQKLNAFQNGEGNFTETQKNDFLNNITLKYLAGNPRYASDINNARKALTEGTSMGTIQDNAASDRARFNTNFSNAVQELGITGAENMTDATKHKYVDTYLQEKAANDAYTRTQIRIGNEQRDSRFNAEVEDRKAKKDAQTAMTNMVYGQYDAVSSFFQDIADKVHSGAMTAEMGMRLMNEQGDRLKAGALQLKGDDSGVADAAASWVDGLVKNGISMIDPSAKTKMASDEFSLKLTQEKMAMLNADPANWKLYTGSVLFQNNVMLQAQISNDAYNVLAPYLSKSFDPSRTTSPIGTNSQVEGDFNKFFTTALRSERNPNVSPAQVAETTQAINNYLSTAGDALRSNNASAKDLRKTADFLASPEFGDFVKSGRLSQANVQGLSELLGVKYEQNVINGITNQLQKPALQGMTGNSKSTISNLVDIEVQGNKLVFVQKGNADRAGSHFSKPINNVSELAGAATDGLNQLVRMSAHLEGKTDYATYWEEHKHQILPTMYPDPHELKVGDVHNGREYIGGNYTNPSNWRPVTGK